MYEFPEVVNAMYREYDIVVGAKLCAERNLQDTFSLPEWAAREYHEKRQAEIDRYNCEMKQARAIYSFFQKFEAERSQFTVYYDEVTRLLGLRDFSSEEYDLDF